jgi:hypothetical protein
VESAPVAARRMWRLFEPVHVVTYFAPEALDTFTAAGLRGFWRGYFAGRAAPIGAVGAPPVIAAFFTFAPQMVARALPAVWELITPEDALGVRRDGAVAALRRLLDIPPGSAPPAQVSAAADMLAGVIEGLTMAGRPLGAPNAGLPVPDEPLARLWHAATVLREHRGDGHVAALVAAGVDGCEALVLRTAADAISARRPAATLTEPSWARAQIQPARGWTDQEWEQAALRLADRGWTDDDGAATAEGLAAHEAIEQATDLAAARPWARLGPAGTQELAAALTPVARAASAVMPFPNPIGIPAPQPGAGQRPAQSATAGLEKTGSATA